MIYNMIVRFGRRQVCVMQDKVHHAIFCAEGKVGLVTMQITDYACWCFGWNRWGRQLTLDLGYSSIRFRWGHERPGFRTRREVYRVPVR